MAVRDSHTSLRICCSTRTASLSFLTLAAMQRGADLAQQALHATDGEVEVDGKGRSQVLDHLVALSRLILQKELVDHDR